jgi:hypothetical protein
MGLYVNVETFMCVCEFVQGGQNGITSGPGSGERVGREDSVIGYTSPPSSLRGHSCLRLSPQVPRDEGYDVNVYSWLWITAYVCRLKGVMVVWCVTRVCCLPQLSHLFIWHRQETVVRVTV